MTEAIISRLRFAMILSLFLLPVGLVAWRQRAADALEEQVYFEPLLYGQMAYVDAEYCVNPETGDDAVARTIAQAESEELP